MHIQLHVTAPTDDPGPNAIDPNQGDLTNGQSPFLGALVVTDPQDEPVVHPDHDLPPEDSLLPDMHHVSQAGLRPSPCAQHLHNVEKYDIEYKMTTHHRNQPTRQPLFNLHRGNTTHNSLSTTPTLRHNPTTTTNRPPTSGNPGDNGKTITSPQMHPTLQGGLTTPNHQPVTTTSQYDSSTKPLTAFSSDYTTSLIARRRNPHTHQVQTNPTAQSMSLQDMLPSTFKTVPRKSGFETSGLP